MTYKWFTIASRNRVHAAMTSWNEEFYPRTGKIRPMCGKDFKPKSEPGKGDPKLVTCSFCKLQLK